MNFKISGRRRPRYSKPRYLIATFVRVLDLKKIISQPSNVIPVENKYAFRQDAPLCYYMPVHRNENANKNTCVCIWICLVPIAYRLVLSPITYCCYCQVDIEPNMSKLDALGFCLHDRGRGMGGGPPLQAHWNNGTQWERGQGGGGK